MRFDMQEPMDADDEALLGAIRAMYQATDPAPDMLPRVLFALDLDEIVTELASIAENLAGSMGIRSVEDSRTITFESSSLRVTIAIPGSGSRHLDGWIEPAGILRVDLVTPKARLQTRSDEGGRFAFEAKMTGQVHLEIHPTPGSAVRLSRRVVTPPLIL